MLPANGKAEIFKNGRQKKWCSLYNSTSHLSQEYVDSTTVNCKSCWCNGKIAKKSNKSEAEYSPPPGIGFCFVCCHLPLSYQAERFQILVGSGSFKHFEDPKLIRGVETRMLAYTKINLLMEIKAVGYNTLFGTAQDILLVLVRDTQDVCRTVKLPIVLVPGLGRNIFLQLWEFKKVSKLFSLR